MSDLIYRGSENSKENKQAEEKADDLVYRGSHYDPAEKKKEPKPDNDTDTMYRGSRKTG